jgi:hypothetical protein
MTNIHKMKLNKYLYEQKIKNNKVGSIPITNKIYQND